jgi:hypothetical protein
MLKSCKTLKEFSFNRVIQRIRVDDEDWASFCEGVSNSNLEKLDISESSDLNPSQQARLMSAITKNTHLKTVQMDVDIVDDTLPYLTTLVNHVRHLTVGIVDFSRTIRLFDFEKKKNLDRFSEIIAHSSSLRYFQISHSSVLQYSDLAGMEKIINRSVHIVDASTYLYNTDLYKMANENQRRLTSCQSSCETLLALKRFRCPQMNLGRDMTRVVSQYLLQTWTDVDSWLPKK